MRYVMNNGKTTWGSLLGSCSKKASEEEPLVWSNNSANSWLSYRGYYRRNGRTGYWDEGRLFRTNPSFMPVIFFGRPHPAAGELGLTSLLTSFCEYVCHIFRFKTTSSGYARPLQRQLRGLRICFSRKF